MYLALKTTELYTLNGWTVWYVNYSSIKLSWKNPLHVLNTSPVPDKCWVNSSLSVRLVSLFSLQCLSQNSIYWFGHWQERRGINTMSWNLLPGPVSPMGTVSAGSSCRNCPYKGPCETWGHKLPHLYPKMIRCNPWWKESPFLCRAQAGSADMRAGPALPQLPPLSHEGPWWRRRSGKPEWLHGCGHQQGRDHSPRGGIM